MYALEKVKVTDFSAYIAGTVCAMLMADMGAEVVKVEPLTGDPFRSLAAGFMGWNRGKRSLAVDLTKDEGREIVYKLVSASDVVVENFRPGVTERLKIDYNSLSRVKPDIVYVSVLGHGSSGPYRTWPGFDPLLQVRSGMMMAQGGLGKPPVFLRVAVNDYAGGCLGAWAAVMGLYVRNKTGKGQHFETSLTNAAVAMQSGTCLRYPGSAYRDLGGIDIRGTGATNRMYEAKDGRWIMVTCVNEAQWRALCQVLGLRKLLRHPKFKIPEQRKISEALVEILSEAIKGRPAAEWLELLDEADVPCAPQLTLDEVLYDPHCLMNELTTDHDHADEGRVRQTGVAPKLSETPGKIMRPAPMCGQHTENALAELGYSRDQIADLLARKVVAQWRGFK